MSNASEKKSAAEEAELQLVVAQIEEDMKNGDYDSALVKANGLVFTSSTGSTKKKWDNTRKTLISQIEEAKEAEEKAKKEQEELAEKEKIAASAKVAEPEVTANPKTTPKDVSDPTPKPTPKPIFKEYIYFGNYSPTYAPNQSYPLKWLFLEKDGDKVLLLSDRVLEVLQFNSDVADVNNKAIKRSADSWCGVRPVLWVDKEYFDENSFIEKLEF